MPVPIPAPRTSPSPAQQRYQPGAARPTPPQPTRLPKPLRGRVLGTDLVIITIGVPLIVLGLWLADGGVGLVTGSTAGALTGIGQLAGLACGLAALAGLALAARPASVERRYGLDRMLGWHRWTGAIAAFGVALHAVALLAAYSLRAGSNPWSQLVFLFGEDWLPAAIIGGALMLLVALTSWRWIKSRMAYETWYYLHVLGYLAVALALMHVLVQGSDFVGNPVAQGFWIALYVLVACVIVSGRMLPLARSLARPLTVLEVTHLPDGSMSAWVGGRALRRMRATGGQFFSLRFAIRGLWWQTHPYSMSAAPFAEGLRFTFTPGDDAAAFSRVRRGTKVWLEGPYGTFTAERAGERPVLLVAGGSGIAPLRAILEDLTPANRPVVLLRVSQRHDAWFVDELRQLTDRLDGQLQLVVGPRIALGQDPLGAPALLARVPDAASRVAFICGPTGMTRAARRGLLGASTPAAAIHTERYFW